MSNAVSRRVDEIVAEIDYNARNAYLGLGKISKIKTKNPFEAKEWGEVPMQDRVLHMFRRPEFLAWTTETLLGFECHPFQATILRELWLRAFPMLVASRGASKSTLLGIYALLRALIDQGSKVLIIGSAFRQAKGVFDICSKIWYESSMLRSLVSGSLRQGPRFEIDRCSLTLGESTITAIPLGNGEKIRGLRASHLIIDEFKSVPLDVIENVVFGFAAVSKSPMEKVKEAAYQAYLKRHGLWIPAMEESDEKLSSNQTIIAGTAYWAWNFFADYHRRYKNFIKSQGDPEKYRQLVGAEMPANFNWKDFSIVKLHAEMLPDEFMDKKTLARNKATMSKAHYLLEYGACLLPGTQVITPHGSQAIETLQVGDLVLTHKGRFKPVQKLSKREYSGTVVERKAYGCSIENVSTTNHPFWQGEDNWISSGELAGETYLPCLKDLSNRISLDVTEHVERWKETNCGEYIYPQGAQSKLTVEQIRHARSLVGQPVMSKLAREFGHGAGIAWMAANVQRKPKNALPRVIRLNYDFGIVMGYYASEGSVGANGRAVSFSLDGHEDCELERFVEELSDSLMAVFGIKPKYYAKSDNVCDVTINSRILADLMHSICPGVAHEKCMRPDILFSNPDFLKGFIVGFWNGDGHKSDVRKLISASSTSLQLSAQVRLALSYFEVPSAISVKPAGESIIRGKVCECREAYLLALNGESAERFRKAFYSPIEEGTGVSRVRIQDGLICMPPLSRKEYEYTGPVHNLQVEDDESYCLLGGAVHNCFVSDSDGFFRRSLVETCVVGRPGSNISHPSCGEVFFKAVMRGRPGCQYIIGVDPASERDNFAVNVLEVWPDHRRLVYSWTSRRSEYELAKRRGLTAETTFYSYCARKLRSLISTFSPCIRLAMDPAGGGQQISESLNDTDKMASGERFIYPTIDPEDPKETDDMAGEHILEWAKFSSSEWTSAANHGLKKDFEDKVLLFPYYDPAEIELALELDKASGRIQVDEKTGEALRTSDTLEDCVENIEDLKDELAIIVHSETGSGRERWDVPERKAEGAAKGRMRKDRYSALLIANYSARQIVLKPNDGPMVLPSVGGAAHVLARNKGGHGGGAVTGPEWWVNGVQSFQPAVVRRGAG